MKPNLLLVTAALLSIAVPAAAPRVGSVEALVAAAVEAKSGAVIELPVPPQ